MQQIAIDIGYGDTKVYYEGKCFKFPSAVEQVRQAQVDLSENKKDVYLYNGMQYRVGQKALFGAIATRGFNFLNKYSPLLVFHALKQAEIDFDKPISIATGLSLLNYQVAEDFINSLKSFTIGEIHLKPKIFLFAQGQGIFLECPMPKEDELIGVIDIGYNTLDFLVFDDNEARSDLCFANQGGANKIIVDLQKILTREYRVDFSEQEAKKVFLNREVKIAGQRIDFKDTILSMTERYIDFVLDEFSNKCGDLMIRSDGVIIGGGGAYFLDEEYIRQERPNIILAPNPYEYSNVRGYYKGAFENLN
ncbi:ParM/StbA family protein [Campylobacter helveticus]|uniref:ParM/StbA family protein n=1 Tax=Campylobacter helveticus TaxID=28898 RepID=UPI0011177B0D|nr:ParM/StbA family protein [Campylobacter helveticus]TNH33903.1 ParM/StbA family protein [Campylobacter helveticus]TNH36354.1 ParM/StbA family protein [Campylobacter helveticus]